MEECNKASKEAWEVRKKKVSSAKVIVEKIMGKLYYEIEYRELSDGEVHVGYGSYNPEFVFQWLEECFEVIE